jgi:Domain of Unknown Function (DUF1206)
MLLLQPFGRFLLVACSLGLLGYAIWRLLMGERDPKGRLGGSAGAALARRARYIASGADILGWQRPRAASLCRM